jgi:hypothetical protein
MKKKIKTLNLPKSVIEPFDMEKLKPKDKLLLFGEPYNKKIKKIRKEDKEKDGEHQDESYN